MGTYIFRVAVLAVMTVSLPGVGIVGAQDAGKNAPQAPQRAATPRPPQPDETVKLGRDAVTVNVTVMDPYGRFVTGLDKSNFQVFDDKIKQDIVFFNDDDAPV